MTLEEKLREHYGDPPELDTLLGEHKEAAEEKLKALESMRSNLEERMRKIECFLYVCRQADKGQLYQQATNVFPTPPVGKSKCRSCNGEALAVDAYVDEGVIFDSHLVYRKHYVCLSCKEAVK